MRILSVDQLAQVSGGATPVRIQEAPNLNLPLDPGVPDTPPAEDPPSRRPPRRRCVPSRRRSFGRSSR